MKLKNIIGLFVLVTVSVAMLNCAGQSKRNLRSVYFDFDRSNIRSDMIAVMDGNVNYLKNRGRHFSTKAIRGGTDADVRIEGNADKRGTVEYNYALGARRAEAVKSYYVSHGISPRRLHTVSFGEDKPVCRRSTESCFYRNRRTDTKLK